MFTVLLLMSIFFIVTHGVGSDLLFLNTGRCCASSMGIFRGRGEGVD